MRTRGLAAAVVGVLGAGLTRVLDVTGGLPGVHESEATRTGMGPLLTIAWLLLAGALAWFVGVTRRASLGVAACVFVSGIPELVTRHDPEAIGEPGALMGALVQLLLLLVVLALVVVVGNRLRARHSARLWRRHRAPVPAPRSHLTTSLRRQDANPRGPPAGVIAAPSP